MSIQAMIVVWKSKSSKGDERMLLLALADSANDDGVCWPSVKHLSEKLNCTKDYTSALLSKLVKRGFLEKQARFRDNGSQTSNLYILNLDAIRNGKVSGGGESLGGLEPSLEPSDKQDDIKINCELKLAGDSGKGLSSGIVDQVQGESAQETKPFVPPRLEPEYVPVPAPRIGGFQGLAKLSREELEYEPVKCKKKSEKAVRHGLEELFSGLTGIPIPEDYKARNRLWWKPLDQILGWYQGDEDKAKELIRDTVQEMDDAGLVISSPNSILNNAVNLFRKEANGKETPKAKANVTGAGREIRY